MDLYTDTAYQLSRQLTLRYSTSFGMSSRLFSTTMQPHIYAIYGLVRIADEIVDTYQKRDAAQLLDDLEKEVARAISTGYSPNPIVHSFALTARKYRIDQSLIGPFFTSMRMDLTPRTYTSAEYTQYIYGSAEVIGLMCLRLFVEGDDATYDRLAPGAKALGSAYQKVNFLRDMASDFTERGRVYFPGVDYERFSEDDKQVIIIDIERDFATALPYLHQLPRDSQKAVLLSYRYYHDLLKKIKHTPAATLRHTRIRLPQPRKISLLLRTALGQGAPS